MAQYLEREKAEVRVQTDLLLAMRGGSKMRTK